MKISVIIPVYNAEKYLESAVESAVSQPETGEVILVEDCSPDNSFAICQKLEKKYTNVRLLRHEGGKNLGAGLTRNRGIENAAYEYVAFLDADDYFLPNRFSKISKVVEENPKIDGVYEAVGSEFESEEAERKFYQAHIGDGAVATITRDVRPDQLFYYLVAGGAGYIHLDGLVVKKEALENVGMFPRLRLHQDTVLCIKLSSKFNLWPGEVKSPVAIRRLHDNNRITNPGNKFNDTRYLMFKDLLNWIDTQDVEPYKKRLIERRYYFYKYLSDRNNKKYFSAFWSLFYCKLMFREDEKQYLQL